MAKRTALTIIQGKTFWGHYRWETDLIVRKIITGIDLSGMPATHCCRAWADRMECRGSQRRPTEGNQCQTIHRPKMISPRQR